MFTLRVTQNTFFKQSTEPADSLSAIQKISIPANTEFHVKSYFQKDRHYSVRLAEEVPPLGKSGFFFEGHIEIEEIRGVWITNIDSSILDSKNNIEEELEKLKSLGFNTIYPVVWHEGTTLHKSESPLAIEALGAENTQGYRGRDILAEIIEVNQDFNFRVIPWFEFGLMIPPTSPLVTNKPDWITHTETGERLEAGNFWLTPCHPKVREFITELIADVVRRYAIDGIQLDDHFGMPESMGFDDFTKQVYRDETGGANPSLNPDSWKKWRINKVTNLLRQVFTAVKAEKEDCIISISPNPSDFSIRKFLADWHTWEREGLIEELVLQVYRFEDTFTINMARFKEEIDKAEVKSARQHIPTVIGIMTGQKPSNKRVSITLTEEQVKETRNRKFTGISFFFFESLFNLGYPGETPEERENFFKDLLAVNNFV